MKEYETTITLELKFLHTFKPDNERLKQHIKEIFGSVNYETKCIGIKTKRLIQNV